MFGNKRKKIRYYEKGYSETKKLIKCPECATWFSEPNWHYCKCPMCDYTLWDERT